MSEKTVGSWAWPSLLAGCAWIGLWYAFDWAGPQIWLLLIALLGVVLMATAIAHLVEYVADYRAAAFEMRQATLLKTSDSNLMLEARLLAAQSPELAGELARRVGRPDLILFPTRQGRRAQIRLAGSDVTLQFALKVLALSDDIYMAAQRQFGDGTYLYDANRELPDRKQWQQFNWVLAREGMVQRYVPNQATNTAPMWLPPWTPQQVLDNWLLPGDLAEILQKHLIDETEKG